MPKYHKWTPGQLLELKRLYRTRTVKECADILKLRPAQVKSVVFRHGFKSDNDGRFHRGHNRNPHTRFREGSVPVNKLPEGAITDRKRGKFIKIGDAWVDYKRYLWEKANGSVQDGLVVVFALGKKGVYDVSALQIVSKADFARTTYDKEKAAETIRELTRKEKLRKKYGLPPLTGIGQRLVNYY